MTASTKKAARRAAGRRFREARERLRVQLWRGAMWPFKPCPTPGVEAFRTEEKASTAAVAIMRHARRPLYALVIPCECGYWHLSVGDGEPEWEGES